jgi:hypothetical protein
MTTHVEPNDAISPKNGEQAENRRKREKKSWHLNKKIRQVAKLEVSDAFEMRGRFIAGMAVVMILASVVFWMTARWMLVALASSLSERRQ